MRIRLALLSEAITEVSLCRINNHWIDALFFNEELVSFTIKEPGQRKTFSLKSDRPQVQQTLHDFAMTREVSFVEREELMSRLDTETERL